MRLFFIEMGQGIISTGDMQVCTSATYTCSLVVCRNTTTNRCGAFHMPSGALNHRGELAAMDEWIGAIDPDEVMLICGQDTTSTEVNAINRWLVSRAQSLPLAQVTAAAGGMELRGGRLRISKTPCKDFQEFSPDRAICVHDRPAGQYADYEGFTLVGKCRSTRTSGPGRLEYPVKTSGAPAGK